MIVACGGGRKLIVAKLGNGLGAVVILQCQNPETIANHLKTPTIMARPTKSTLSYFPCDCSMFNDCKVIALSSECGAMGQLVYVHLLCAIYSEGYYLKWDNMMDYKLQRDIPGLTLDELQRIIGRAVEFGLFDAELFATEGVLTSRSIQSRYFEVVKRRVGSDSLPYLLLNHPAAKPAKAPEAPEAPEAAPEEAPAQEPLQEQPQPRAFAQLKAEEQWQQAVRQFPQWHQAMERKAGGEEALAQHREEFQAWLITDGRQHKSPEELRGHFSRWLNLQINPKKDITHGTHHSPSRKTSIDSRLGYSEGYGIKRHS